LKEVLLVPWGTVESKRGTFILDREAACAVVAEFTKNRTALVIDYEHQTLGGDLSSPDGKAPAAGWIEELVIEENIGLKGLVQWTDKARDSIRAGEYRYLSPVLMIRQSDKRAVALHSAALTNVPAISGSRLGRLAASTRDSKETVPMTEGQADTTPDLLIGAIGSVLR
jgi:phage I-like protein